MMISLTIDSSLHSFQVWCSFSHGSPDFILWRDLWYVEQCSHGKRMNVSTSQENFGLFHQKKIHNFPVWSFQLEAFITKIFTFSSSCILSSSCLAAFLSSASSFHFPATRRAFSLAMASLNFCLISASFFRLRKKKIHIILGKHNADAKTTLWWNVYRLLTWISTLC